MGVEHSGEGIVGPRSHNAKLLERIEDLPGVMEDRDGWGERESGISVLATRLDDFDLYIWRVILLELWLMCLNTFDTSPSQHI